MCCDRNRLKVKYRVRFIDTLYFFFFADISGFVLQNVGYTAQSTGRYQDPFNIIKQSQLHMNLHGL